MTQPLSQLASATPAIVESYLDDNVAARLISLGVRPLQVVKIIRWSPLGDAIYLTYGGSQLALRRAEADKVIVRPI
jgi:Fe2+ transport system protein FeoA